MNYSRHIIVSRAHEILCRTYNITYTYYDNNNIMRESLLYTTMALQRISALILHTQYAVH